MKKILCTALALLMSLSCGDWILYGADTAVKAYMEKYLPLIREAGMRTFLLRELEKL